MTPIRILAYHGIPWSAGAFYRGFGALYDLQRRYPVQIIVPKSTHALSWEDLWMSDVVYFRAPHRPVFAEIMRQCRILGIKTWADFDDDHLAAPETSNTYKLYMDPDNVKAYHYCVDNADLVTVSTEYLATKFSREVHIIENALPDQWIERSTPNLPAPGDPIKILLRGSPYHAEAIKKHKEIIDTLTSQPNVHLTVFGPKIDTKKHKKVTSLLWKDSFTEYLDHIQRIKYQYFLVLWDDTEFSKSKSNIAYLEATMNGAVTLVPPFEVFERGPVFPHGNSASDIADLLTKEHHSHFINAVHVYSKINIKAFQSLSHTNQQRYTLLTNLTHKVQ